MTEPTAKTPPHPNAIKLHDSCIPRWTHSLTLADEGYPALEESLKNKGYMADNGVLTNFYMQAETQDEDCVFRTYRAASLLAKQLRLSGVPVMQVSLPGLLTAYRLAYGMEREIEPFNPAMSRRGEGYIVIPDLHSRLDPRPGDMWPDMYLHDAADWLLAHVHAGGGLVFAGYDRFHGNPLSAEGHSYTLSCFGHILRAMIQDSFTVQIIK